MTVSLTVCRRCGVHLGSSGPYEVNICLIPRNRINIMDVRESVIACFTTCKACNNEVIDFLYTGGRAAA